MTEKCFAKVQTQIVDNFIAEIDDLRAGLIDTDKPHYDDKAFTLFLLLRFYANGSFQFYTNEYMLCELMGISSRAKNRNSIMLNILKMQEDGLVNIYQQPNKKFFYINLDYEMFMPEKEFVVIYKEEFDNLIADKVKDKLLLLLYCVKKFQYKKTGISFTSIETLMDSSHISKPTICRGLKRLDEVLYVYKARINFNDGTYKDVNYYKSCAEGGISVDAVMNIAKKYYRNVKSIIERTKQNDLKGE